ncbi:MAG: LysR substrate-binding domain-containing protein [Ignavibacteriaceae bacterium]
MNIQQLEYIVAVDRHRHFARAAEACFVTQPTLSTMIQKLEEELGIVLFDRTRQPVIPTEIGKEIIEQARKILSEAGKLKELVSESRGSLKGELKIGIIPTLAPYLLPLFLRNFLVEYPNVKVKINEMTTNQIVKNLSRDSLDVGILATPLNVEGLREVHLFYERFMIFVSGNEKVLKKKYLLPEDIDVNRLWLLEEGHCLRSQMLNLCELREKESEFNNLEYEAGSIESLLKIVEMNSGLTVVPELAVLNFDKEKRRQIRFFRAPVPVRQISLVTYRHFVKNNLLKALKAEIVKGVEPIIGKKKLDKVVIEIDK